MARALSHSLPQEEGIIDQLVACQERYTILFSGVCAKCLVAGKVLGFFVNMGYVVTYVREIIAKVYRFFKKSAHCKKTKAGEP